jgi:hypothetical protein
MKMNRRSKKTFEEGDVFAIPLKPSGYPFGLVCTGKDFAFFNFRSDSASPPEQKQQRRLRRQVLIQLCLRQKLLRPAEDLVLSISH